MSRLAAQSKDLGLSSGRFDAYLIHVQPPLRRTPASSRVPRRRPDRGRPLERCQRGSAPSPRRPSGRRRESSRGPRPAAGEQRISVGLEFSLDSSGADSPSTTPGGTRDEKDAAGNFDPGVTRLEPKRQRQGDVDHSASAAPPPTAPESAREGRALVRPPRRGRGEPGARRPVAGGRRRPAGRGEGPTRRRCGSGRCCHASPAPRAPSA